MSLSAIARLLVSRLLGLRPKECASLRAPTILVSRPYSADFDRLMQEHLRQPLAAAGGPVLGVRGAGDSPVDRTYWVLQFQLLLELADLVLVLAPDQNANVAFEHFLANVALRQRETLRGGGGLCRTFLDGFGPLDLNRCARRHGFTPDVLVVTPARAAYAPPATKAIARLELESWSAPESKNMILKALGRLRKEREDRLQWCVQLERQAPTRYRNSVLDLLDVRRGWADTIAAQGPFAVGDVDSRLSAALEENPARYKPMLFSRPLAAVHGYFLGQADEADVDAAYALAIEEEGRLTWGALQRSAEATDGGPNAFWEGAFWPLKGVVGHAATKKLSGTARAWRRHVHPHGAAHAGA